MDADLGFGILRVTRDQKWRPLALLQPLFAVLLGMAFEWGIALYGVISVQQEEITDAGRAAQKSAMLRKMARQAGKDYVLFPALSRRRWRRTLGANIVANGLRSGWAYIVIVCGHFVDGAEKFTPSVLENETKREWYLRQMLGTANFDAGPTLRFMTGNLCYQIEHHLYPDLPHNRYPEIAERVPCSVRHLRTAVHDWSDAASVPAHRADNLQVGAAGSVAFRYLRRRTGNGL